MVEKQTMVTRVELDKANATVGFGVLLGFSVGVVITLLVVGMALLIFKVC